MSAMKKWMVGSLTAMVVGAGSLATLAGPAQAYDRGNCDRMFGAANVEKVDTFRAETGTVGQVDFGDLWPWTTAVACWHTDGRVALVGRVFADSGNPIIRASAKVTFFRDGVAGTEFTAAEFWGNNNNSKIVSLLTSTGFHNRVRIRLFRGGTRVTTITCVRAHNPALPSDCTATA